MFTHLEPGESYPEPTRMPGAVIAEPGGEAGWAQIARVAEWRYDPPGDGTRYRAIVVYTPQSGRVLVAVEPDQCLGRSWWALDWHPGDFLSDEYIAEKWRIRPGDDLRNLAVLIRAALERRPGP